MAGLPEWFGLEAGLADCARAVRGTDGLVADLDGEVVGFVTWRKATPVAVEITWLAVRRDLHRRGVGRALVDALVSRAPALGGRVLTAWTVSDADPDPGYARTRQAYAAFGFMPVAEAEHLGRRRTPRCCSCGRSTGRERRAYERMATSSATAAR